MSPLIYATGNKVKFIQAQEACGGFGITLQQTALQVDEIQGEDSTLIARDKAAKAFAKFQQPIVISDDSWAITALNGFPGPYMKSVNDWFSVKDWLNLTRSLTDRRVYLQQIVVYQDGATQKVFSHETEGILLSEPRGKSPYAHCHIISFDNGETTIAEYHERDESATVGQHNVWHDFAEWYQAKDRK